jgi:hypothetical protein
MRRSGLSGGSGQFWIGSLDAEPKARIPEVVAGAFGWALNDLW